jgi:3'(2'), 5'-bisphosphate nucleotidase
MPSREKELQTAVDAVRAAATVCQQVQRSLVTADTLEKKDKSPVTVADFASQATICAKLAEAFPGDPVAAEENANELRKDEQSTIRAAVAQQVAAVWQTSPDESRVLEAIDLGTSSDGGGTGRFWTLDPIDGTKGFLRGQQYAIALALIEDGKVVLGVLGCPNLPADPAEPEGPSGVLMTAVAGQGGQQTPLADGIEPRPVAVSEVTHPRTARFVESVESAHSDHSASANIADRLGITHAPVRMDSQAKYAAVARGQASIYLRMPTSQGYREKIWDHAAGKIVVEEAGGRVTDISARPLDFACGRQLEHNSGVVATNGHVHDPVLEAVSAEMSV